MPPSERPSLRGVVDALASLASPADFEVPRPTFEAVRYRPERFRRRPPVADIYLPVQPNANRASVILVHGGAFTIGSRRMKPIVSLTRAMLDAGFAVMTFDYRLLLRGGRIEEQVDDVAQALLFWVDRSSEYGLAADKRSVVGLSAGGTLMLLALARLPSLFQRAVSVFAVYDFTTLSGPLMDLSNRMLFRTDDLGKRARWSPHHVFSNAMPLSLLHGTDDSLVPYRQAENFARARRAQNLPVELLTYEGAGHGFFTNRSSAVARKATAELLERLAQ